MAVTDCRRRYLCRNTGKLTGRLPESRVAGDGSDFDAEYRRDRHCFWTVRRMGERGDWISWVIRLQLLNDVVLLEIFVG